MPKGRKSANKLTAKVVDKLLRAGNPGKHTDHGDGRVKGLMLDVRSKSGASWCLRFQVNNGRTRFMGLGSAREFSLAEARERAKRARQQLADKVDPLTARRAERAAAAASTARTLTFAQALHRWFDAKRPGWSPKHSTNTWDALAKWAVPVIGKLDVGTIETPDVLRVLQQPVNDKTLWLAHTSTAATLRNNIRLVLDWAAVSGLRAADKPNPARWGGHLEVLLPAPGDVAPVTPMAALDYRQVPELMAKLATREGVGAAALRFMIMTASRINEAANAAWDEINLEEGIWTVPAERMKARREWRQPLAAPVIELLRALPTEEGNPYLFLGTGQGEAISDSALRMTLRREGYGHVVSHGFRSSFSTWSHERTAHSNHAIELSLAHSVGNAVEQAYRRGDMLAKRRRLMADWAKFVTTPAATTAGNVTPIRGAR